MRLLLVGDSNCLDLEPYLKAIDPSAKMLTISVGSNILNVFNHYNDMFPEIVAFDPSCCIIHCGHNDLAFHAYKNPQPSNSTLVAIDLIDAAMNVQRDFPTITIAISSPLPRSFTSTSTLPKPEVEAFNRTVKRLGQRIRAAAEPRSFVPLLNNKFWRRISKSQEEASLLDTDGLHLNDLGKAALINDWAAILQSLF
jgi:lysophospholipase L1-like esterase